MSNRSASLTQDVFRLLWISRERRQILYKFALHLSFEKLLEILTAASCQCEYEHEMEKSRLRCQIISWRSHKLDICRNKRSWLTRRHKKSFSPVEYGLWTESEEWSCARTQQKRTKGKAHTPPKRERYHARLRKVSKTYIAFMAPGKTSDMRMCGRSQCVWRWL